MHIIGHRGAKGLAPENTLAGLEKAQQLGVDEIEFDVRVTKDNVPVLAHDKSLRNLDGKRLRISTCSYADLKKQQPALAKLEEVLESIAPKTPVYIEVKKGVPIRPIVEVIKRFSALNKHLAIGSKSQATLIKLHAELPDIPKIVIEPWSGVWACYRAKQVHTNIISMYHLFLWFGFVKSMHKRGYKLYAYTINNPRRARSWAKHGLAGVVTDFPDRYNPNR